MLWKSLEDKCTIFKVYFGKENNYHQLEGGPRSLEYNFHIMGRLIYTRSNNMTKDELRTNLNNLGEMFELVTETCYVANSLCGDDNR